MKIPFGIAQVGKAFRNEIVARQFIFRTREFEQMELQYFLHPKDMREKYEMWKKLRWDWYLEYGLNKDDIQWHKHEKLAHYASEAYDIEYNFKSIGGFREVEGIHARGDFDLSQHAKFSGVDLSYLDEKTNEKFIPHVMETSAGLNRMFLMFIDKAYTEEETNGEIRTVLKVNPKIAAYKMAVIPLASNKPELIDKADAIFQQLNQKYAIDWDDSSNIGKKYRRQDEIGTPWCLVVDYQTLEDNTVSIRDRDTMEQIRIKADDVDNWLEKKLNN
jgi:glycyl-tRNA synthetase